MSNIKVRCLWLLAAAGLGWLAAPQSLAQGFGPSMSTVGTSIEDDSGRQWSYLLWQTDGPLPFPGGQLAVYRKTGPADSADSYQRRAIVQEQVEAPTIQSLISRSVQLGDDPVRLEGIIDSMFQELIPVSAIGLSEKISAVLRGAMDDPAQWDNLLLLARSHPSMAMCLGVGYSEVVPDGTTLTYELREWDADTESDLQVVGRVTIQSGNPVVLPAPGMPVVVPDATPKGHLNVKLRWATPDPLRRLSPLQFGFNIYRMDGSYAESQGFDATPPGPAQLQEVVSTGNAVQVNRVPVLVPRDFTQAEAIDFHPTTGDPDTYFAHDDNRRYEDGGTPFNNGDAFYYFITGRDLLGRDGFASDGTLAIICDRLPPPVPRRVQVENHYEYSGGSAEQRLKVGWELNDNSGDETTTRYYVYRWDSPNQMNSLAGNPAANRIAAINHIPGAERIEYIDDGAGAPSMPADAGRTFYYTVRALDDGACDANLSGNSVPVFGVLRDREGPAAPGGVVNVRCLTPEAIFQDVEFFGRNPTGGLTYILNCKRIDSRILWAEFYVGGSNPDDLRARRYFPPGADEVQEVIEFPIGSGTGENLNFYCRVGTSRGTVSFPAAALNPGGTPNGSEVRQVNFEGRMIPSVPGEDKECDGIHDPRGPSGGGVTPINPITGTILLTDGTKTYRVYRRVDGGSLTLVEQGEADFDDVATVNFTDPNMPAQYAEVCYYGQLFDEHGNPSPLRLLECIEVVGTQPLPVPMLAPLSPAGDESAPKMQIKWFSPPYGVEQFEIWMATTPGAPETNVGSTVTENQAVSPNLFPIVDNGETNELDFAAYRTGRVGGSLLGNGPAFETTVEVELGKDYTVMIRAVGRDGSVGDFSNVERFTWHPKTETGPQVPWPARGLPPVDADFNSTVIAGQLPSTIYDGLAVRVGAFPTSVTAVKRPYFFPDTSFRPMDWIAKHADTGEPLFPAVLYRYQLPNANHPDASGDLVQVSPLMEDIAIQVDQEGVTLHDEFIYVRVTQVTDNLGLGELFLVDTHPMLRGARYGYLLVKLDENGEIDQVIPTNVVEAAP